MKLRGILVASAALGLLAGGVSCAREAQADEVKCAGVNSCGAKGECAAADGSHDCGGKNSCKGKGWMHTKSAAECAEKGGTVVEDEA